MRKVSHAVPCCFAFLRADMRDRRDFSLTLSHLGRGLSLLLRACALVGGNTAGRVGSWPPPVWAGQIICVARPPSPKLLLGFARSFVARTPVLCGKAAQGRVDEHGESMRLPSPGGEKAYSHEKGGLLQSCLCPPLVRGYFLSQAVIWRRTTHKDLWRGAWLLC
ncbi:hypothetical protein FA09DRAFT_81672 [Tilletiopsis washingtonensis]|uniref:Uncharacterized protein n=1 Tax=Tilletiopsis washingtonensis TaxID=58919 RepID=A0A316Z8V9_9BASI|nr:hypothetical protein FA09DRAFT_81672 [Tilletiopsis washingtonensis]PWN96675.1 hypothetical protein FA09DRAFT_81672 [Tilletiopsis washingtonensis]